MEGWQPPTPLPPRNSEGWDLRLSQSLSGQPPLSGHLPVPRVWVHGSQLCAKIVVSTDLKFKGFIQTLLKLFSFFGEWENGEHEKWNDPKTV